MSARIRIAAVVLAALVSVGALGACSGGSDAGTGVGAAGAVTDVSASDAVKVLAEPGITVIDVRTPTEYASGHLAGAVNIDIEGNSFDQQVANLPKTDKYFVYCRSGNRSGAATAQLAKFGFTSVFNLRGGIAEWQAGGGALVTS